MKKKLIFKIIKSLLKNRIVLKLVLLISIAYPVWFFIGPYELIIGVKESKFSSWIIASFLSINYLIPAITSSTIGYLSDKFGKRWVFLIISELLGASYMYLIYQSIVMNKPLFFLIAAILSGLATSFWNPILTPYISDVTGGRFKISQILGLITNW